MHNGPFIESKVRDSLRQGNMLGKVVDDAPYNFKVNTLLLPSNIATEILL